MTLATRPRAAALARHHRGYAAELRALCQRHHLLGFAAPLTEVLIEPRFLQKPPLIAPVDENLTKSVLFNVPLTYEFPALHSAYHVLTHSLDEIGLGARHVAILGQNGSGRTTALHALALYSMGLVQFTPPPDVIQQRLAAEEKKLKPEERAERVRQNVLRAQQTRESLATVRGKDYVELMSSQDAAAVASEGLRALAPMYAHLADLVLHHPEYGAALDPAEPLIRALQAQVSYVTAQTMPPALYSLIDSGRALLLLDGLDEVPLPQRADVLAWLKAFTGHYGANRVVITALPGGALELHDVGFHTAHLRPWDERMSEAFLERVAARAARIAVPGQAERARWLKQARLLPPRDLALALIEGASASPPARALAYARARAGENADPSLLERLAWAQLSGGAIRPEDAAPTSAQGEARRGRRTLSDLAAAGILTRTRGGRYRFAHQAVMAALASPCVTPELAQQHLDHPDWQLVLTFAAAQLDMQPLVARCLTQELSVDMAALLKPAHWLPYAASAEWRVPYMRLLAHWLVQPHQYLITRETLAAALLMSGDASVSNVFRRMLTNANADCRRVAVLALGALRDLDATETLSQMAHADEAEAVQVSAALALGALRSDDAARLLIGFLQRHPSPAVRRAAAECLAALPEQGYPALFEAIRSPSLDVRRATVWGLGRVGTDWALIALNERFLEDREVFVRLAVQQVYVDSYEAGALGIRNYPVVSDIDWIRVWSQRAIDAGVIPKIRESQPLVLAAIQQKQDLEARLHFIVLAGQLGFLWATEALYRALYDAQEAIRDSAFRSLVELAQGYQLPLPQPPAADAS